MYKLIFKLAFNNAFLRMNRTLLVIVMISVSMSMMINIQGLYDGMTVSMIDKTKRSDSGDISIYAKGYRLSNDIKDSITDSVIIEKELSSMSEVKSVSVRLKVDGLISTAKKSSFSKIIGIDLEKEESFGEFSEFLDSGKLLLGKRGALLGSELAKTLKVKLGSKIIFSTQDSSGEINSISLKVRGIIKSTNIVLDSRAIFVDKKRLSKFLMLSDDVSSQIAIRTDSLTLKDELSKKYENLDIKSFMELNPMMKQYEDVMVIFNSITFFIVMTVVFIGIMGVMYVSILDRIREFGIMRSIGLSYGMIRIQILAEALFIGVFGYLFGALIGFSGLYYLATIGLDLSTYADGMESFGMSSMVYSDIKLDYFTNTFFAIVGASLLSVIPPLRKIKTMNSIEVTKVDT